MSQTQTQVKYRPGSATLGVLAGTSDSLDTEYSPDEEDYKNSVPLKGILVTGNLKNDKIVKHVRFDGACILASRCIKLTAEDQPNVSIQLTADDDTDQDEADDEDYEESEADDDDDETDTTEDEEEDEEVDENTLLEQSDEFVCSIQQLDEDETDVETDNEDIAQINKRRNQRIVLEKPQAPISITEETYDSPVKAGSLLSSSGFPPSSPDSPDKPQPIAESLTEDGDGLMNQTFAIGPNGVKRAYSKAKIHMFYPTQPSSKKRCLGTRRLVSTTQAKVESPTKKTISRLLGPPTQLKPVLGRRSPSRVL